MLHPLQNGLLKGTRVSRPSGKQILAGHPSLYHTRRQRIFQLTAIDSPLAGSGLETATLTRDPHSDVLQDTKPTTNWKTAVEAASDEKDSSSSEKFDWLKQWYPIRVEEDLDPTRPHADTLLGRDIVLWRDGQKKWHCFENACPHRAARLSEGIITGGNLQCSYHGWKFNGTGKCVKVPQVTDPKQEATICSSSRSCARALPCMVTNDLIWVWPDPSTTAFEDSAAQLPALHPEVNKPGVVPSGWWFVRDVPNSYDTILENTFDAAHTPFVHHGVLADKNKAAEGAVKVLTPVDAKTGFKAELGPAIVGPGLAGNSTITDFKPPSYSDLATKVGDTMYWLLLYRTPIRPGLTRGLARAYTNSKSGVARALAGSIFPTPLLHLLRCNVQDADFIIQHYQERNLETMNNDWAKVYYLPAKADVGTTEFRKWFDKMAGGAIPWMKSVLGRVTAPNPKGSIPPGVLLEEEGGTGASHNGGVHAKRVLLPKGLAREKVLDRYEQHVKLCPHCQKAIKNANIMSTIAAVASVIVAVSIIAVAVAGAPLQGWRLLSRSLAFAGLAAAAFLLKKFVALFYFVDYDFPVRLAD